MLLSFYTFCTPVTTILNYQLFTAVPFPQFIMTTIKKKLKILYNHVKGHVYI